MRLCVRLAASVFHRIVGLHGSQRSHISVCQLHNVLKICHRVLLVLAYNVIKSILIVINVVVVVILVVLVVLVLII